MNRDSASKNPHAIPGNIHNTLKNPHSVPGNIQNGTGNPHSVPGNIHNETENPHTMPEEIDNRMEITHGGDRSGKLLDFSANITPLGVPDGVRQAICEAAESVERYPDPFCGGLTRAIARTETVPEEFVLCGAGASDLIFRAVAARRPKCAVVTAPTFAEYERALSLYDCPEMIRYPLREELDFRLDDGFLNMLMPSVGMVFLCQPNNPTGITIPKTLLLRILSRCREIDCRVILDECFVGFLDHPDAFTLRNVLSEYPNLLILRAFTKLYGCAGVRLGYALCADGAYLRRLRECGPPWSVSTPAQKAGLAALCETAYAARVRTLIARERPRMYAELCGMGLRVISGEANFLLFHAPVPLDGALVRRGMVLRNCGNFHGLNHLWYRAAIRTPEDNNRLLTALREILPHWD